MHSPIFKKIKIKNIWTVTTTYEAMYGGHGGQRHPSLPRLRVDGFLGAILGVEEGEGAGEQPHEGGGEGGLHAPIQNGGVHCRFILRTIKFIVANIKILAIMLIIQIIKGCKEKFWSLRIIGRTFDFDFFFFFLT